MPTQPPRKLRLATVITAMTYGGAQRILIDYLSRMPDWVENHVYGVYPGEMADFLRERNIPITELDYRGKNTWRAIWPLRGELRKFRPHIVHTHLGKADFVGRAAARLAGVPVVVTTVHNKDDWKENGLLNFIDNQSLRLADEVIAVAGATQEYLLEKGFYDPRRLRISYARVELRDRFATTEVPEERRRALWQELELPEDALLSIQVGRFYPQKAQEITIQAMARLHKQGRPEWRPHVVLFAGEGPQWEEQKALAAKLLPAGAYRFLGNRRDVEDLLKISDVYVMPSRWEGAPLALQEAFAAGLPAVCSDIPSMSEVIESCGGAVIFPMDDARAMADRWLVLLQDEALRRQLGERARINALKQWDIRHLCKEYLKTYADACRRSRRLSRRDVPLQLYKYLRVKPTGAS